MKKAHKKERKRRMIQMDRLGEIRKYIEKTKIDPKLAYRYSMTATDLFAILSLIPDGSCTKQIWDLASLAFRFGMAKGYRAAMKEKERKEQAA